MLIPISHESNKVRRLPWVSFFIMACCLVIHIMISVEISKTADELESTAKELVNYYIQHPYLKLGDETKKLLFGEKQNKEIEQMLDVYRRRESGKIHLFKDEEQQKLDQLAQKLKDVLAYVPYRKYGYIPAQKNYIGLVTYMFVHGGWLHLIGNLLLLYLTGPFIEDVWGRPIFTAFYIMAGIFSGFMFSLYYPHFTGPLIGASGAIAGLMGAFLIKYWKTKIKFFFFIFIFHGTFKAPAWLMLPIWLALEIFSANRIDSASGGGSGVAHWAHIWGFIFGVVMAAVMNRLKIEEKYVHPKIEAQVHFVDEGYKAFEEATQKISEGKTEEAYVLLLDAARKNPNDKDVVEGLWNQANEIGKENEAAQFYIRLIESEIRRDLMDIAYVHFTGLKEKIPRASLSMTCKFTLMTYLTERQNYKEAKELANELIEEVDLNSSPGLLQNFANAASEHSPEIARKVMELCLEHPGITDDEKDKLRIKLKELQTRMLESPPVSEMGEAHEAARDTEDITAELESQLGLKPEAPLEDQPAADKRSEEGVQPLADSVGQTREELIGQHDLNPERKPAVVSEIQYKTQLGSQPAIKQDSQPVDESQGQPLVEPEGQDSFVTESQTGAEPVDQPGIEPETVPEAESESPSGVGPESKPELGPGVQPDVEPEAQQGIEADKPERGAPPNQLIMAVKATPLSVKDGKIALNMDQIGQQLLPLNKVKSIAIAEITPDKELPFMLIDLFLDDPKANNHNVRAIRLLSTGFDPTKFSPGIQDKQDALKVFVSVLLRLSGATAYPDEDSILLEAPQSFLSIEDYEKSILA
jgi:membrane associated rhomboid family serine protease